MWVNQKAGHLHVYFLLKTDKSTHYVAVFRFFITFASKEKQE
jgi:hypothetical protein